MKGFIALPISVIASVGLMQIVFAGPEPFSGKEMKQVAPAPLPECNWTGFYLGVQGGYGWGDLRWTTGEKGAPEELIINQHHSGYFVGGEEGYNYQIGRWLVIGAEGDFSYSQVDATSHRTEGLSSPNPGPSTFETGTDWAGSIGLRAGVAFHHFLFFAKGGVSFAHLNYSWFRVDNLDTAEEAPHTESFKTDETRAAPMVGGGVEYMINCHWSAKLEYKHLFLGRNHIHGSTIETFDGDVSETAEQETYKSKAQQDTVQAGLNYKF